MISKTREIFTTKGIVKGKNTKALEIFVEFVKISLFLKTCNLVILLKKFGVNI
jgi:hypothetical protein